MLPLIQTNTPTLPQTFAPVVAGSPPEATEFITGYDATTGLFSSQPRYVPAIRGNVNITNITEPIILTGESEDEDATHLISIYADSHLDGGGDSGDNTLSIYLTWTDPSNETINTLVSFIDGTDPQAQYVTFTGPVYPKVGSVIVVSTVYGGAAIEGSPPSSGFTYDLSVSKIYIGSGEPSEQFIQTVNTGGAPLPVVIGKITPIIQASETRLNSVDVVTPLYFQLPVTTTYQVTMYYFPSDTSGSATQWWHPVFTWTTPAGLPATSATSLLLGPCGDGDPTYGQAYSTPILAKGGTPIIVTGFYTVDGYPDYGGGACTPFPIDLSIRVVAMP